jgi:lipopolysaccharide transport system ATP-binding protein
VVDEVLAVGDAEFQKKAIGKMQDVSKGEGRTVLFVSHNMGSIRTLCQNGVVLSNGVISFLGKIYDSVDYYLNLSKSYSDLPLSKRVDRQGTQTIKVVSIEFKTMDGNMINTLISGQDFIVCLSFEKNDSVFYENFAVSLSLTDENENPLFLIHSRLTGDRIDVFKNEGIFQCIFRKLPLNAGIYNLSFSVSSNNGRGILFDSIANACEITVEAGNFYQSGELAPRSFGPLLIDGSFNIK